MKRHWHLLPIAAALVGSTNPVVHVVHPRFDRPLTTKSLTAIRRRLAAKLVTASMARLAALVIGRRSSHCASTVSFAWRPSRKRRHP